MSSPVEKNRDRPDGWMYAPRWAQDGEDVPYMPSPQLAAQAEPAEPRNFDELAAQLAASMAQPMPAARAEEPQPHEFAAVPEWMHKARGLEPIAMPMPPMREPSRFRPAYAMRALAFAGVAAAGAYVFVYGMPERIVRLADARLFNAEIAQIPAKSGRLAIAPALVTTDIQGAAGDWVPLNIALTGGVPAGGDAIISGFPPGTSLSAGEDFGAAGWRVDLADLPKLRAHVPPGFAGSTDLVVEMRGADASVLDRKTMRLDIASPRLALASVAPAQTLPPNDATERARPAFPPPAQPPFKPDIPAVAALPRSAPERTEPARKLEPSEIAMLLRRGEELTKTGDLAGARLLLQRAADARHAGAAFALAATYDPIVLRQMPVIGQSGDADKARYWYERAREFGSRDAAARLESLAQRAQ
ncbi:MAG: hypothetical protein HXY30_04825 [Pseudorhodoplanes sp.]|nr:hypothetical protein [Pseudorhodoplanes sp.]